MRSPAFPLVVIPFLGRLLMVSGVDSSMGFRRGLSISHLRPARFRSKRRYGPSGRRPAVLGRLPRDYSSRPSGAQGPASGTAGHLGPVAPSEQQRGKALVRGRGRKAAKPPDPGAREGLGPGLLILADTRHDSVDGLASNPLGVEGRGDGPAPGSLHLRRMLGELVREAVVVDEPRARGAPGRRRPPRRRTRPASADPEARGGFASGRPGGRARARGSSSASSPSGTAPRLARGLAGLSLGHRARMAPRRRGPRRERPRSASSRPPRTR